MDFFVYFFAFQTFEKYSEGFLRKTKGEKDKSDHQYDPSFENSGYEDSESGLKIADEKSVKNRDANLRMTIKIETLFLIHQN